MLLAWPPQQSGRRGLTLVEVIITVSLITLITGALVFGSGMVGSSHLRAGASLVVASVRAAVTEANSSGKTVRLVFDFEAKRVLLESAAGSVLKDKVEPPDAGEHGNSLELSATAESQRILSGASLHGPDFLPVKSFGPEGKKLDRGVQFREIQIQHDAEPLTTGRAYLYFWPGGETEWASIQLSRTDSGDALTVMVSALSGRARIEKGKVGLPTRNDDGSISEREEP